MLLQAEENRSAGSMRRERVCCPRCVRQMIAWDAEGGLCHHQHKARRDPIQATSIHGGGGHVQIPRRLQLCFALFAASFFTSVVLIQLTHCGLAGLGQI
jgi:hypothetical protein